MTNRSFSLLAHLALATAAIWLSAGAARADVRDAAEYFSPDAERQANDLMQQVRQRHGKDVVVETVASMPGVPQGARERDDFYAGEAARRGREAGVKGIYILVSRQPTYVYPGVDPDTRKSAFTMSDRVALRDLLVSRFQGRDFDGGLIDGLKMIDQRLTAHASGAGETAPAAAAAAPAAAAGDAASREGPAGAATPAPAPAPAGERRGMGNFGWLILGLGALLAFALFRSFALRRRGMAGGGPGAPGYGPPQYDPRTGQPVGGGPGYDPRYGPPQAAGGGGGGLGRGLLGGVLGGMAGGYLYDQMRGGGGGNEAQASPLDPNTTPVEPDPGTSLGGNDFGGGDLGGGDFGGGDFGGGDFGGGE